MSNFTKTFKKILEEKHYGEEDQDAKLTEILELISNFPNFEFGESLDISMETLIIDRYYLREIGFDNDDNFMHYFKIVTQELLIKYVPKIKMWIDNFNSLFEFKVTLDLEDNQNFSNGSQNTYYLNPITANTGVSKTTVIDEENKTTTTTFSGGNLKVQDLDTNDNSGQRTRKIKRDVLQSVWGKTRPMILQSIFELKDIYNMCLNEFDKIFMGVF